MPQARVRVGVGGWTYPPWRETFYPPGLPQKRELEYASRQFGTLEINATFYGRQSPKSWETWAKTVPDDFQFAIKGSRFCVTRTQLCEGAEGISNFFAQGLAALGPTRIGYPSDPITVSGMTTRRRTRSPARSTAKGQATEAAGYCCLGQIRRYRT